MIWLDEYKKLNDSEKEVFRSAICDEKEQILALEYDRMIAAVKRVADKPEEQISRHNGAFFNVIEDMVLSFENEAYTISEKLYRLGLIDLQSRELIVQIKCLFDDIGHNPNNDWSYDFLIRDTNWNRIRVLANEVLLQNHSSSDFE